MLNEELENQIIEIEEQLWSAAGDPRVFNKYLSDAFVCNFSYADGYYGKKSFIETAIAAPRWKDVSIDNYEVKMLSPELALATYDVTAEYEVGGGLYVARVSSIYTKQANYWRVLLHHHYV